MTSHTMMLAASGGTVRAILASLCLFSAGCSDSKTADYYYNHQLEAREKLASCHEEPLGVRSSEACMNAVQAVRKWAKTMQ